jgi:hypothetical protein
MRTVSDKFLRSLRESHILACACRLVFPDGQTADVPVEEGSVTMDRTAQARRSGTVRIPWSLRQGTDLGLDLRSLPLGGYAQVRRGLRYADGSTELVLLGHLRVESVTWDTLAASASLELSDRMAQVRDEPFTTPYSALGKRPAQAAVEIVRAVFADTIDYLTPYDPATVIGDVLYTATRPEALSDLEQGNGAETYFTADGDFVFDQKPGDSEPVVWTVDAGDTGVMVAANESLDRTGIYNGVLVKGQPAADQPPVSALAVYSDISSPIRWGGPFGKVALIADSTTVTDAAQAQASAESLLRLRLKQTRSLELTAAPNPALEAGDTIRVLFPDGRDEHHLIDAVTVDLSTGAQRITTRSQAALGIRIAALEAGAEGGGDAGVADVVALGWTVA